MQTKTFLTLKSTLIGCALLSTAMAHEFKSGMYLGPQIGGAFQHTTFETTLKLSPTAEPLEKTKDKHSAHFIFGGTAGYRFVHKSNFVLGLNLDADFDHRKIKTTLNYKEIAADTVNQTLKRKYTFSPSLVLGHIINPKWMVFSQLGMVISKFELKSAYPTSTGSPLHKKDKTLIGFAAGLGTEYAMNKMWSIKGSANFEVNKTLRAKFQNILGANANDFKTIRIDNKSVIIKLAAIYKI